MSVAVAVGVALLGGLGSVARFLVDGAVSRRVAHEFPFGTLAVNLSGSAILGFLVGAAVRGDAYEVVGVGLLGGYTTFSTWMLETQRLAEVDGEDEGGRRLAALNVVGSLVLGVLAAWAGRAVG